MDNQLVTTHDCFCRTAVLDLCRMSFRFTISVATPSFCSTSKKDLIRSQICSLVTMILCVSFFYAISIVVLKGKTHFSKMDFISVFTC